VFVRVTHVQGDRHGTRLAQGGTTGPVWESLGPGTVGHHRHRQPFVPVTTKLVMRVANVLVGQVKQSDHRNSQ
jgi:hypothetical protein